MNTDYKVNPIIELKLKFACIKHNMKKRRINTMNA